MRRIGIIFVFIALAATVIAAQAEVTQGSFSVAPYAGGYFFEGNEDLKETYAVGLRAGYNLTENIGIEGFFHYVPTNLTEGLEEDVDLYCYGAEGLYHFMPDSSFVPFVAVGVGGIHYRAGDLGEMNKLAFDYGAGLKYFFTDNIALRADVRHVIPVNDMRNNLLFTLGVHFAFGGSESSVEEETDEEPSPPPPPVQEIVTDSDGDGVSDKQDMCPGTPFAVVVDKDGCPSDSDKDGVPDYLDKCPGTPEGIDVNKDGCPSDSDNDGVSDNLDKCQGTPAGVIVDKEGCPPVPPVMEPKVERISMTLNIEFNTAKSVIKKKYHDEIKKVADFMKEHPESNAIIEGHTDNVDIHNDPMRNIKLSQARADSVRKYLIEKFGIEETRIAAVGHGPNKPIADNSTSEGRKKNRRVEAVIEAVIK